MVNEPAARLVGEWTLVSWSGVDAQGARVSHGGDKPSGELIYLESWRMAVQIQHDERAAFGSTDWSAGEVAERAAAYSTFNAYCGTFVVPEPGVVVHHVELAIHPDHPGMEKRREFELDGDELTLRTQDVETPEGPATSQLVWRRRA
ncbi:MAG TPA: lipocalin-like domain-containing protein [Solirubrobacterales bacterium]|nr:lipocalin-like domain-containing protein [Solirubrobacterales bacterium]